jgi:type II secretory pathway component GspD/PulD (secretin)
MYKKLTAIYVTASALAFFLLAFSPSYAGTKGGGLKSAALLAQQALQAKPGSTAEPQPSPTPAEHPQAQPKAGQPRTQPRLFPPVAPKPATMPEPAKPRPATSSAVQTPPPVPAGGAVSFNFDDADVYSVIQTIFGDVLRVNYVIDPAVKGRVTFRSVEPVAKKDVLPLMEVILRLNGIGIVQEGTLYRIIPIADISKEPAPVEIGRNPDKVKITGKALVQIVQIKYMQSSEMVKILTPFLSKNAVIVDIPNSNYIVIVDTDSNVRRLLRMVNLFDSEELKAATPRVFVYPIQNGKAKDVATLLQQIFLGAKSTAKTKTPMTPARRTLPGQKPSANQEPQIFTSGGGTSSVVADDTKIIPDEVTNSLIILATPEDYGKIKDAIAKIDTAPRQVMIEALIVSVKLTDNLSFGLSWSLNTDLKMHPFRKDINLGGDVYGNPGGLTKTSPGTADASNANGFTFVGTDPSNNVRAVLTALQDHNNATVVAAPHILVSDNKEAKIQIGSQIPIATSTSSTPIATSTTTGTAITSAAYATSTIQYKDIGIILKVKPQVNDSGLINLDFSQEVSSVASQSVQVGGLSEVTIDKTEAQSSLVARDGETIVIGGLIREDKTKGRSGIPFLSRIPILGYLFGNTSDQRTRTELIILLTPHVVRNEKEAQSVTSQYLGRYKGVTRDKDIEKFVSEPGQIQKKGRGAPEQKQGPKDHNGRDQKGNPSPAVSP